MDYKNIYQLPVDNLEKLTEEQLLEIFQLYSTGYSNGIYLLCNFDKIKED